LFTHDICEHVAEPHLYCFSGHVHPGVIIKGAGKQALKFPCYYFGKEHAVLPAFSKFTGIGLIEPKEKEFVFAIVEHSVIALNN
jgi:metallophosphoesterase superfamily enzyme